MNINNSTFINVKEIKQKKKQLKKLQNFKRKFVILMKFFNFTLTDFE